MWKLRSMKVKSHRSKFTLPVSRPGLKCTFIHVCPHCPILEVHAWQIPSQLVPTLPRTQAIF